MENNKIPTIVIPSIDNHIEKPVLRQELKLDLGEIQKPILRRQHAIYPHGLSPPPLKRQTAEMYETTPEQILRRQNSKELSLDYSEILSECEKK